MFHQWKSYLKRHYTEFNNDWYTTHMLAIQSITPQQGLHYFRNTTLVDLVKDNPLTEENVLKRRRIVAATAALIDVE